MTTQNTTTTTTAPADTNLKEVHRVGQLAHLVTGETYIVELFMANRGTHFQVEMLVFMGSMKMANVVSEAKFTALSVESARTAWAAMWAKVTAVYSVLEHETLTTDKTTGTTRTDWKATPAGGIRKLLASFWDGNEGSYTLEADFVNMVLRSGGTPCPDIPVETTEFPVADGAKGLDNVFQRAVAAHSKRYRPTGVVCVTMNWVRTEWREGVAA